MMINRRDFSTRVSLGMLGSLLPSWTALAARRQRRQSDLVIDAIRWSDDHGDSWHAEAVLAGSDVWFEATVRNAGSAATSLSKTIEVQFRVDGVVVSWSHTHQGSLAVSQSIVLRADGGPDGNEFWVAANSGSHTVQALVDPSNSIPESNEKNNSKSTTLNVDPANDLLIANDVSASTQVNTTVNISVLVNDSAPPGQTLVITSVQSPTDRGGTAVIMADRKSVGYTPPTDFVGQDSFTYEVAAV